MIAFYTDTHCIFFVFQCLDGRTSWGTLINAFRILVETNDDKLYVVYNGGLQIVFEVNLKYEVTGLG